MPSDMREQGKREHRIVFPNPAELKGRWLKYREKKLHGARPVVGARGVGNHQQSWEA